MSSDSPADLPDAADDRLVCFCHGVRQSEIIQAIRAGAITHAAIQEKTRASTGCGGCECEVLDLLERELKKLAQKAPAEGS